MIFTVTKYINITNVVTKYAVMKCTVIHTVMKCTVIKNTMSWNTLWWHTLWSYAGAGCDTVVAVEQKQRQSVNYSLIKYTIMTCRCWTWCGSWCRAKTWWYHCDQIHCNDIHCDEIHSDRIHYVMQVLDVMRRLLQSQNMIVPLWSNTFGWNTLCWNTLWSYTIWYAGARRDAAVAAEQKHDGVNAAFRTGGPQPLLYFDSQCNSGRGGPNTSTQVAPGHTHIHVYKVCSIFDSLRYSDLR